VKKTTIALLLICTAAFAQQKGTFTDSRDKKKYKTVKIGEQTWMAENLNYNATGSKCYDNNSANCTKYGRMYDWSAALKACPKGWHLPSDAEWDTLVNYAGGWETAGKKLKSVSGWNNNGGGTDDYGFSALPGGGGDERKFDTGGDEGYWWSATEDDDDDAWCRNMVHEIEDVLRDDITKTLMFSVRCVKD